MIPNSRDLYLGIHEYIHQLVGDTDVSLRLVNVFIRAEVPLQTFITAAKLYRIILNRSNNVNSTKPNSIKSMGMSNMGFKVKMKSNSGEISEKLIKDPYTTFVSCCVISSKFYKDIAFNNESWGEISCLDKVSINEFERNTLSVLDYKVNSAGDSSVMKDVQVYLNRAEPPENNQDVFDIRCFIKKLFCFS